MSKYGDLAAQLGIIGNLSGKELRANCPIHQDRNPSFSLNVETGLWTCFSRCGHGNFQQLVEKVLSYTWQEAKTWIDSNGQRTSLEDMLQGFEKRFTYQELHFAQEPQFDWRQYYEGLNNYQMPQWLLDRGFTWDTINHWGFRYDIVMDALVVPVFWEGNLVGTITRNTMPDKPKYQNSPELPRDRIFFGEINRNRTDIILCEGVLDAVWLWQLGYHGVSVLGESLTQGQIQVLRNYRYGSIVLALDNDEAGINGTRRAASALVQAGWLLPQIKRIRLPGDYRNKGPEYRKDVQECSANELEFLFERCEDVIGL